MEGDQICTENAIKKDPVIGAPTKEINKHV